MTKWLLPIILAVLVIVPSITHAESGISATDSSAQIYFPSALTFTVNVESGNDIVKVRLHYQVDSMNYAQVTSEAWPVFTPSTKIKAQWVWDMRKAVLPVGTTVAYWWTIEDATGDILTTPAQKIRFDDIRYDWKKITSGQINLFWYQGNQNFADQLMAAGQQTLMMLAEDTGVQLEQPVNIYIYASAQDLQSALIFPQEWSGGVAYYAYRMIAIGIPTTELDWGKGALAHELGHMVSHQITFSPYGAILPFWLDEGLAMYAQVKSDPYLGSVLEKAIAQHNLISVRSLASPFSAIPAEAYLSYAESQSIVSFLIQNYTGDKILQLLNLFKEGNTYDEALIQVYGFDQDGLDALWQEYVTGLIPSQSNIYHDTSISMVRDNLSWYIQPGQLRTMASLTGVD